MEVLLENSDIEILYCQPDTLEHLPYYARKDMNPQAIETGFDALAKSVPGERVRRISWPFQQEELPIQIEVPPVPTGEIVDSRYYFAWASHLDVPGPQWDYRVRVTIRLADPERPGEFLEESFSYMPYNELAWVVMSVTDEVGNPTDEVQVHLYAQVGDREEEQYWPSAVGGIIRHQVHAGDYSFIARDLRNIYYDYNELRYVKRGQITVPAGGLNLALQVETADKEIELAKAKGLLRDLGNWGYTEKPFLPFADAALSWLEGLEQGGMDWREMELVKRFYVALSGYVNTTDYAEVEVERAVEDFIQGSKELREVLERLTSTGDDLHSWYKLAVNVALLVKYSIPPPNAEAIGAYGGVETLAKALIDYVKGPFVEEVLPKLIEQLPVRSDLTGLLKTLVNTIILGKWDQMEGVLKSIADLALNMALDKVKDTLEDAVKQALLDALARLVDIPEEARGLFQKALLAFFEHGFDGWSSNDFINDIKGLVNEAIAKLGGKDKLLQKIDDIFARLQADESVGAGPLRDFILPFAHLVLKVTVENYEGGKINDDFVIEILARLFCNWVVERLLYSQPLLTQMNELLQRAQSFQIVGSVQDRTQSMDSAFHTFRGDIMDPLNEAAWDALELQNSIDDWEYLLSTIATALRAVEVATVIPCFYYPTFCDVIDDIDDLIMFLEALQVMTNILEFGVKMENLATLPERTWRIPPLLFPKYLRVKTILREGAAGLQLTWQSLEGETYRVQYKDDLRDVEWRDLSEEIVASGAALSWTDAGAGAARSRFYRVIQLP